MIPMLFNYVFQGSVSISTFSSKEIPENSRAFPKLQITQRFAFRFFTVHFKEMCTKITSMFQMRKEHFRQCVKMHKEVNSRQESTHIYMRRAEVESKGGGSRGECISFCIFIFTRERKTSTLMAQMHKTFYYHLGLSSVESGP